jgi:hypothetical protein
MNPDGRRQTADGGPRQDAVLRRLESAVRRLPSAVRFLSIVLCGLFISGCSSFSFRRQPPPPGVTTLKSPLVQLPAQHIGNYLVLEAKWDRNGPYHFLIDTGSSVTLVTPTLARRYPGRYPAAPNAPRVRVTDADGRVTELPPASLRRLELGEALFEDVPVLLDTTLCAELSAHLGVRIDGVLGFPMFRETLLTLDYPGSRVLLQPTKTAAVTPGTVIPFDDSRKTPLISLRLGERSFATLIDSGSDAAFSLNPAGLNLQYAVAPRPGPTIGTIGGDRTQQIGRLGESLALGDYVFERPIVDLTDELSTIGGGVLKYFAVTFDQSRDRVMFHRDTREPIQMGVRRSAGVSFSKTPAYWRVAGVVPGSSAAASGVHQGDLITRINGEPVAKWDLIRYEQLVSAADDLRFLRTKNAAPPSCPSVHG